MGLSSSTPVAGGGRRTTPVIKETETGTLTLRIPSHSATKGVGVGKSINSSTFTVGGHRWHVAYFPDGESEECSDWVSVYLYLDRPAAVDDVVRVEFRLSLLDRHENVVCRTRSLSSFSFADGYSRNWGYSRFVERWKLESPLWSCFWLQDTKSFQIRCEITMKKLNRRAAAEAAAPVVVPPSNLHRHLGHLLASGVGADVSFVVGGEVFRAHRNVLAARSRVFMAELFGGGMQGNASTQIQIDDMDPSVFRVMLHFIYTDSLPYIDCKCRMVMAYHLAIAAQMYGLERLELICDDMLHKGMVQELLETKSS